MAVLGFDVGGANTKAAYIKAEKGKKARVSVASEYFPMWKNPDRLPQVLVWLKQRLGAMEVDALAVTMTAELSDAYQTKREGVNHILTCLQDAFASVPVYVLNSDAELFSLEDAKAEPLRAASANWSATGWIVALKFSNALVVDVGSTSTTIIPIIDSKVAAFGKTDLDKLVCGELVYTGSLRTNVAAIAQCVPTNRGTVSLSSELFALSGDVHLVLGNISTADYTSETADSRGKTFSEALARLARVVCADTDMLTVDELLGIARYLYSKQVEQIAGGIKKVYAYAKARVKSEVPVVVTGLGRNFLARKAAEQAGVGQIIDLDSLLPSEAVYATPAFGTALMVVQKLGREDVQWF